MCHAPRQSGSTSTLAGALAVALGLAGACASGGPPPAPDDTEIYRRAESESGARTISGRRVNLRDGPSIQHAVLAVLSFGTPVFPEREEGDWALLRTADGPVGWVHRSLIR